VSRGPFQLATRLLEDPTSLWRWTCSVASSALWRCTSRRSWLERGGWLGLRLVLLGAVAGPAPDAAAQADNRTLEAKVNIPYVVQFGFGSYEVGGLSVNGFQLPVSHTFALGSEPEAWRLMLIGYLGYSHASFETRVFGPKVTGSEDFAYLLPYAELQIPLWRGWTVKPFVAAGLGRTFNRSVAIEDQSGEDVEDRFISLYAAGVSNLFEVRVETFLFSLGTKLAGAVDVPIGLSGSEGYGTLQNGLEVRHPIGFRVKDVAPDVGVSFVYYYFFPSAKFSLPGQSALAVSNQFEFGVSVGSAKPFELWIFENPRIGVSYRFGDGLTGVRANFGFPF
jgi:hypothetical protein